MQNSEIETKAAFDHIRYAQLWEDADVLTQGLGDCAGGTLVSICSAGDNALAMLVLDPKKVIVVDLSPAQIACLQLRIGAFRTHTPRVLELMGARASTRRRELLLKALAGLDADTQRFWQGLREEVALHGAGGVGKFERYFRIFRTRLLPFVHSRKTIDAHLCVATKTRASGVSRYAVQHMAVAAAIEHLFSRFVMGRMGRDKAFFDHVDGSPAQHVARRIRHAAVTCDPAMNPYLHWIMKGDHGAALPMTWRAEHYEVIRSRLDRIEIRPGSLEAFVSTGEKADGFNLSDIFEYMSPEVFKDVYGQILNASAPGARLVYWNMMAPRRVPEGFLNRVETLREVETRLKAIDKAFFYSDFVVEQVRA